MNTRQVEDLSTLSYRILYRHEDKIFPTLYCERELNPEELALIDEVLTDTMKITGQDK